MSLKLRLKYTAVSTTTDPTEVVALTPVKSINSTLATVTDPTEEVALTPLGNSIHKRLNDPTLDVAETPVKGTPIPTVQ